MSERSRPRGAQEYKGNGKHEWEEVATGTDRLRVPGGWLYAVSFEDGSDAVTFVPVPNAVGYAV